MQAVTHTHTQTHTESLRYKDRVDCLRTRSTAGFFGQLLQTRFPMIKAYHRSPFRERRQNTYWQSSRKTPKPPLLFADFTSFNVSKNGGTQYSLYIFYFSHWVPTTPKSPSQQRINESCLCRSHGNSIQAATYTQST